MGAKSLVSTLEKMLGSRKRCVYCCDSRSSDIDHFKPVKLDLRVTFKWKNFILICPECNRCKGSKFEYGLDGKPLLVDPTAVDPWDHLVLDVDSGVMAPRYFNGNFDARGEYTLDVVSPVNDEATVEGRRRAAERYLDVAESAVLEGDTDAVRRTLVKVVKYDEFGLASWFAFREGSRIESFVSIKRDHPALWRKFCSLACRQALNALES
ncbi:hypothetical protein B1K54_13180 [Streptomyces sp. fd1-xmd]|uniref:HNH nuclease domain-containing protein n=1 Tax=Streptomyces amritsarensis TaxID=681158 RepID=A0ABX3GAV9_9ACTN|nr:hypothetical protein B1K54_13180 [Streptomyces sp. fd1-xmd]OLZ71243.1 hypothetical protein AVW11_06305 [Streptomyces amritsarensis]